MVLQHSQNKNNIRYALLMVHRDKILVKWKHLNLLKWKLIVNSQGVWGQTINLNDRKRAKIITKTYLPHQDPQMGWSGLGECCHRAHQRDLCSWQETNPDPCHPGSSACWSVLMQQNPTQSHPPRNEVESNTYRPSTTKWNEYKHSQKQKYQRLHLGVNHEHEEHSVQWWAPLQAQLHLNAYTMWHSGKFSM